MSRYDVILGRLNKNPPKEEKRVDKDQGRNEKAEMKNQYRPDRNSALKDTVHQTLKDLNLLFPDTHQRPVRPEKDLRESDVLSSQAPPGRVFLIRGPGGYGITIPIRSLSAEIRDSGNGNSVFTVELPRTQANALLQDISTAIERHRSNGWR